MLTQKRKKIDIKNEKSVLKWRKSHKNNINTYIFIVLLQQSHK